MTELVESRCEDCSRKSFQCTPCSKQDVTVRKLMREQAKANVMLSQYRLFEFPPMPPPAPLVLDNQVVFPPPSISSPMLNVSSDPLAAPSILQASPTTPTKRLREDVPAVPKKLAANASPSVIPVPKAANKKAIVKQSAVKTPGVLSTTSPTVRRDEFDLESDDASKIPVPKVPAVPKKLAAKASPSAIPVPKAAVKIAAVKAAPESDSASSNCDTCSCCSDSESDDSPPIVTGKAKEGQKPPKMAKISLVERSLVIDWCSKDRKDGKMNNARWIRNGGAKGSTMTATSGEVRTSGAYEALAT
jgi:hypothetical protein